MVEEASECMAEYMTGLLQNNFTYISAELAETARFHTLIVNNIMPPSAGSSSLHLKPVMVKTWIICPSSHEEIFSTDGLSV